MLFRLLNKQQMVNKSMKHKNYTHRRKFSSKSEFLLTLNGGRKVLMLQEKKSTIYFHRRFYVVNFFTLQ